MTFSYAALTANIIETRGDGTAPTPQAQDPTTRLPEQPVDYADGTSRYEGMVLNLTISERPLTYTLADIWTHPHVQWWWVSHLTRRPGFRSYFGALPEHDTHPNPEPPEYFREPVTSDITWNHDGSAPDGEFRTVTRSRHPAWSLIRVLAGQYQAIFIPEISPNIGAPSSDFLIPLNTLDRNIPATPCHMPAELPSTASRAGEPTRRPYPRFSHPHAQADPAPPTPSPTPPPPKHRRLQL